MGYVLDDPTLSPAAEGKAVLEKTIQSLDRAGLKVKSGWPPGVQVSELLSNYLFLLYAFAFSVASPDGQEAMRKEFARSQSPEALGALSSFADWQSQNDRRLQFRALWQTYFEQVDVFLSPVAFTTAFSHDHSEPQDKRSIITSSGTRRYWDLLNWIAPATLTGCPATVAPAGRTEAGLPVGIQIMGPYWEDVTPITFADLLARKVGGFKTPPGYDR